MPVLMVSEITSPQPGFSRNWVMRRSLSVITTPNCRGSFTEVRVMVASALLFSWKSITFWRLKSVKRSPEMIRKRSSRYFSAYFTAPAVPMSSSGVT